MNALLKAAEDSMPEGLPWWDRIFGKIVYLFAHIFHLPLETSAGIIAFLFIIVCCLLIYLVYSLVTIPRRVKKRPVKQDNSSDTSDNGGEKKMKRRWIVWVIPMIAIVTIIGIVLKSKLWVGAIALTILLIPLIHRIPFPEVWLIDRFGNLVEKKAGLRIIIPGVEKIYKKVPVVGMQYGISLFPDRKDIRIGLRNGGQLILKDPRIWINIKNGLKAVKTAKDFEEQIREITEHRLSGSLNSFDYEEVMEMKTPKVLEGKGMKEKIDEVMKESKGLTDFLSECGIKYRGFTLDDFDFDESTMAKRRERILSEMGIKIAENLGNAKKNEMLAIVNITKELRISGFPAGKAQEIAAEIYQDHLVGEKGKLQKIIWPGGGIGEVAAQWELGKKLLSEGMPMGKEEKPKKEEKNKKRAAEEEPEEEEEEEEEEKPKKGELFY